MRPSLLGQTILVLAAYACNGTGPGPEVPDANVTTTTEYQADANRIDNVDVSIADDNVPVAIETPEASSAPSPEAIPAPAPVPTPAPVNLNAVRCDLSAFQDATRFDYPFRCETGTTRAAMNFTFVRNSGTATTVTGQKVDANGLIWSVQVPILPDDKTLSLTARLDGPDGTPFTSAVDPTILKQYKDKLMIPPQANSGKSYLLVGIDRNDTCIGLGAKFLQNNVFDNVATLKLDGCYGANVKPYPFKVTNKTGHGQVFEFLNSELGSSLECMDISSDSYTVGAEVLRYACHSIDPNASPTSVNQEFTFASKGNNEFVVQAFAAPTLCIGEKAGATLARQIGLVSCAAGNPIIFKAIEVRP